MPREAGREVRSTGCGFSTKRTRTNVSVHFALPIIVDSRNAAKPVHPETSSLPLVLIAVERKNTIFWDEHSFPRTVPTTNLLNGKVTIHHEAPYSTR
jgi:hypothetical protein